ncbi:DUF6262 family protein [Nocardia asteroides]
MTGRSPADVLREARRRDSQQKRARVLATVDDMVKRGDTVTFAAVAQAANVSTWLVYAPGVREHVDAARHRQAQHPARSVARGDSVSTTSLRTDLELAREEISRLRTELEAAKKTIRRQLGQQLECPDPAELLRRAEELDVENRTVRAALEQLRTEHDALVAKVGDTEDDLLAARESVRRMIRNRN